MNSMNRATKAPHDDIGDMTAQEIAREIRHTMARLAKLQAVLVDWASNAEDLLAEVAVHPVEQPAT